MCSGEPNAKASRLSAQNHTRKQRIVGAGLSLALAAATTLGAAPRSARAVTLDELQQQLDASNAAYNEAVDQAAELEDKIAANQERIDQIEAQLPEKKQAAASSMRSMYKMQLGSQGLIDLLISADDFNQVVSTIAYLDAVVSHNTGAIDELANLSGELNQTKSALSSQKAQADERIAQALSSLEQASAAHDQLEQQQTAERAAAEQAAKDAAAASAADAVKDSASAQATSTDSAAASAPADSGSSQGSAASSASNSSNASSSAPSQSESSSSSDVETNGEWMSGLASAYSTAGGNMTASGEVLTDDSMTVAVPASQSYLLGRSVQIQYGGVTITARVTDTGGFASYGRVLDLAGGCWKAFGFSSTDAWGVRAVRYRFV